MKDGNTIEIGEAAGRLKEPTAGDRRPSVEALQNMLKRVSQSPFHSQYKTVVSSNSESSSSSVNYSSNGPMADLSTPAEQHQINPDQNEGHGAFPRTNPFYSYFLESAGQSDETSTEASEKAEKMAALFVPAPAFQSSPMDQPDAPKPRSSFQNVTLDTPDIFKASLSSASHNGYTSELNAGDGFSGTRDPMIAPNEVDRPFKAADSLFSKPVANTNPFHNLSTNASNQTFDFFNKENQSSAFDESNNTFSHASNEKLDFFSPSSDVGDLSPKPVTRNIDFSNIEDPFANSPLQLSDPFQDASLDTSDIFNPISPKVAPPRPKPPRPTPPRPTPPARITKVAPAAAVEKPQEIILTSPQGSQHSILQPTPLILAQSPSESPSPSQSPKLAHVSTFRRPPRPLPRIRRSRTSATSKPTPPEKPPKPDRPSPPPYPALATDLDQPEIPEPEKSPPKLSPKLASPKLLSKPSIKALLPKPVVQRRQKKVQNTVDPENYVVFEDILLIGQEQCVEDWPEDSPEVQPDFKPRGTLRLRRESLMAKTDSETEDVDGTGSSSKKTDKLKTPVSSRRNSKERFSDECTSRSRTQSSSRKSSKEFYSDTQYSSQELRDENEDPEQWVEYKKPHFRHKMNSFLRRSSASAAEHKHANGNVPRDAKDYEFKKSVKESFRRHSEGTQFDTGSGESGDDFESKKNRKLKSFKGLLFNKHNEDELKGAHGHSAKGSRDDLFDAGYNTHRKSMDNGLDPFNKDEFEDVDALKAKLALSPTETYDTEEDQLDVCEQKKTFKIKGLKKPKLKSKSMHLQKEEPFDPNTDFMSEAAKAEFMAAEKDRNAMDEFEDGEGDEETDSLMEWWDRVEQWDEVPSDEEEMALKEDESKSFSVLADKVQRALRLFNKVFVERAEVLWQSVITLHTIADDISTFHNKARIAGITGGTTTAVGGVAAIAGLALAPVTFGASLIVTAVGVGVATAGGITSASAAISDNVNNANDRKKVEAILLDNEASLLELSKILHFANTGLYKLRGHPFLRSGTQHYSQDWEVRRAVQMIGMVDSPVMKATDFIDSTVVAVQGLFGGMDKYFLKDSRELKKGCKKEIVAQIKDVANVLNDCIVELNAVREELQEGIGDV